jgi:hypothetical protein
MNYEGFSCDATDPAQASSGLLSFIRLLDEDGYEKVAPAGGAGTSAGGAGAAVVASGNGDVHDGVGAYSEGKELAFGTENRSSPCY